MTDLVAFLRARLDEDEAAALTNVDARDVNAAKADNSSRFEDRFIHERLVVSVGRVLREIEAKRLIVDRHQPRLIEGWDGDGMEREGWFCSHDGEPWPCPDVRDAVAPYSDHPDYDPAWRPT